VRLARIAVAVLILVVGRVHAKELQADGHGPNSAEMTWEKQMADRERTSETVSKLLQKPLTVASAVQIALMNNQVLQVAFGEAGIAQADVIDAVTIPNPSVDFDVQFPAVDSSMSRYGWVVAQDFIQLLMAPLKKKIAQAELDTLKLRLADQALELTTNVKIAYFTCQADQQLLSRLKLIQETNAAALDLSQKQFAAGNTTEFSLLQAQSTYSQGRLDIANAEADLRSQREMLNRLLGLWGADTDWQIKADLMPVPDFDFSTEKLEALAIAQRLDLRAAYRDLTNTISALGLTKSYRSLPALKMGFSGERDIDGALNLGPSVSFEVPIFNQGQSRIARGEAQVRIDESKLEALAVNIRSQVRESRDNLISLSESAKFYQTDILPTRTQMMKQAMLEYNAMALSPYVLYQTKSEEAESERAYIDTVRDYWITRAELERAVGGTLTPHPGNTSVPATSHNQQSK
jgi:cobalt-zinc-cadmium efflux system outer membrane protein